MIAVEEGEAGADDAVGPRQHLALCGVDTEKAVVSVCLEVWYRCSGLVEDDVATEGRGGGLTYVLKKGRVDSSCDFLRRRR